MRAGVLMHHHPRQRGAFALDAMLAPGLGLAGQPRTLQHRLDPAVAACALELAAVLAVKVRHVPACKAALVGLHDLIKLRLGSPALGDLAQPLVQQALQSVGPVALDVAAKTALALPQQHRRLGLRQPPSRPSSQSFFESHLPVLLHVAGPAYGSLHRTP
jgi:hypothetical protein